MAVSGQVVTVYMIIIKIIILSKQISWCQNTKDRSQETGVGGREVRVTGIARTAGKRGNILDPQNGKSTGAFRNSRNCWTFE